MKIGADHEFDSARAHMWWEPTDVSYRGLCSWREHGMNDDVRATRMVILLDFASGAGSTCFALCQECYDGSFQETLKRDPDYDADR